MASETFADELRAAVAGDKRTLYTELMLQAAELLDEKNTRPAPAATDTGLVTVAWESMDNKLDPNDKLVYEVKFPRNGDKRLVYKSQAEELLAAERAEKEEAENGCLTAVLIIAEKDARINFLERVWKKAENRAEALEAKLAAAEKALARISKILRGDTETDTVMTATNRLNVAIDAASAALGGKPS